MAGLVPWAFSPRTSIHGHPRASPDKPGDDGEGECNVVELANYRSFLTQLCVSAARPYWRSTSFLRSPIATGPAAPPPIRKSPFVEHTLPIGEMTAAVPQAKASFSFPLAMS